MFTLQNNSCAKSECQGTFKNASRVNPKEQVIGQINSTLVTTPTGQVCEWRCKDNYILSKGSSGQTECLQCKAGTRDPTTRVCIGIPDCEDGYVAAPGPDGIYKCFPLGNCLDETGGVENNPGSFLNRQYPKNYRPIARTLTWTYVPANPREHQCEYTCDSGYLVNQHLNWCRKIECESFPGTESLASTYKYTPEAPSLETPKWSRIWVLSEAELVQKRNSQARGCYYYCLPKNQYKESWGTTYCYSEKEIKEKEDEKKAFTCKKYFLGGLGNQVEENPQQKDHPWTYVPDKTILQSKQGQAGCFWSCSDGYTKGERNGKQGCYRDCKKNEYWYSAGFGWCKQCPLGKIGDPNDKNKVFGNPTNCKDACEPGTIWTSVGGEYGSCISAAGQDFSCPSGMTLVTIKGEYKCLACLPGQTLNQEKGICE